ncbi:hypothetical protein GPECTOR_39g496 [Gonium pectorale]|uniref:CHRD domain-containing protein n=1 Tax=Gonium pectorale TaxID=33097 RepID=A0A150GAY6_GONPE|nr:hypothetical protein GPECTOR_39g496 [Gonium pectorale]|eukprot:KXZ47002.1 hypothetical protein GPECTOR_39g496 [Gonium pectorale]
MSARALTTALLLVGLVAAASAWPKAPAGAVVATARLAAVRNLTTSRGHGRVEFVINGPEPVNGTVSIALNGVMANITMVHIHQRNASLNNPVRLDLVPRTPSAAPVLLDPPYSYNGGLDLTTAFDGARLARWGLSVEEFLFLLKRDKLYVNVHTLSYPGGEIQGMLKCKQPCRFG